MGRCLLGRQRAPGAGLGRGQGSLEEICRDTWWDLYLFVYWRVQNREEAQDVTQEAYARLLGAAARIEVGDGRVAGLLKTIALNVVRDGWRRWKVRGPLVPLEQARLPAQQLGEDRLLQGYPVRETAQLTGKTEAAVRSLQFRGLKRLAQLLADETTADQSPGRREGGGQREP